MTEKWNAFNLLPDNTGELYFLSDFISESEAILIFNTLKAEIQWQQGEIKIYGKQIREPRLTAWYGDAGTNYRYSGKLNTALAWHPTLLDLKKKVEKIAGTDFNSVLLNYYRSGQDSMGWHRDNEPELGPAPCIASVSFGAEREFVIRNYKQKSLKMKLKLNDGSLLLMKGAMQQHWEHALPKRVVAGERINLTFRYIVASYS